MGVLDSKSIKRTQGVKEHHSFGDNRVVFSSIAIELFRRSLKGKRQRMVGTIKVNPVGLDESWV